MSRAKSVFAKTSSKHLDAIVTERSMFVKPTKRKYQKEVLQRLDRKRNEECHQRCGKRNEICSNSVKCLFFLIVF